MAAGAGSQQLMAAVVAGDLQRTNQLLAGGADPNVTTQPNGRTALHEAASRGHGAIVGALLARGANPNTEDVNGNRPTHAACECESGKLAYDMCNSLRQMGADVKAKNKEGVSGEEALNLVLMRESTHQSTHPKFYDLDPSFSDDFLIPQLAGLNGAGLMALVNGTDQIASTPPKPQKGDMQDVHCPICLDYIREAFITKCGHSFCYTCINTHLKSKSTCPSCQRQLDRTGIIPNFALNKLVEHLMLTSSQLVSGQPTVLKLQGLVAKDENMSVNEIEVLMRALAEKKRQLEADDQEVALDVLMDFLLTSKALREKKLEELNHELLLLSDDIDKVDEWRRHMVLRKPRPGHLGIDTDTRKRSADEDVRSSKRMKVQNEGAEVDPSAPNARMPTGTAPRPLFGAETGDLAVIPRAKGELVLGGVGGGRTVAVSNSQSRTEDKKALVRNHIEDLQECYFATKSSGSTRETLEQFRDTLAKCTRFSKFKQKAILRFGDMQNTSAIVSSIEFDKDYEMFATAGVTKKIKVFDFANIDNNIANTHVPIKEMLSPSKISCLSWNSYQKNSIASSDYEGVVTLWDTLTGQDTIRYSEHEKRAWSVDFCRKDPRRLASGSDDSKVKVWATNMSRSAFSIESNANVCCVKFNPESADHIAFGSADHHIHYYDLRSIKEPVHIFKGHRKAVSYVKFLNKDEMVSASTDSTLRLWDVNTKEHVQTFTGHSNEKNFVGLTTTGDYIACGSENNAVYTYYKGVSKPVVEFKFGAIQPITMEESEEDTGHFVSSVCWKPNSNILLAANSQGTIKVMEAL